MKKSIHKSVLLKESIDLLNPKKGTYVDCTLGGGGHSLEILSQLEDSSTLISLDFDSVGISRFRKELIANGYKQSGKGFTKNKVKVHLEKSNFSKLKEVLKKYNIEKINGCIADLGISSDQLENYDRGFSYINDGPLDMRMDQTLNVKAEDLVNGLYQNELEKLFRLSDEKYAKKISKEIVKERKKKRIKTTKHLTNIIKKSLFPKRKKRQYNYKDLNPYWLKSAMRVFQALRIAVNSELNSLQVLLPQALESLVAGGNFVVISFHSGEAKLIKTFFKKMEKEDRIKILTKKPIMPTEIEIQKNNRSRSAQLRAYTKLN